MGRKSNLILIGIGLGILAWVIVSAVDALLFHEGYLISQVFSSDPCHILPCALIFLIIVAFSAFAQSLLNRRERAEERLRQERDRAQKYLDIADVMFVVIDADKKVALINKKGAAILGYEEKEIMGKNWFDSFLPERLKNGVRAVSDKLMAGEVEPVEYYENPVLTKSGEERTIAWHNTVLRDEQGKIVGHLSCGEDITERKQIEQRLRLLSAAVEQAGEGVALTDSEGKLLFVNPAYAAMHGYQAEELLGRHYSMLRDPGRDESLEAGWEVFQREGRWSGEARRRRKDGSVFYSLSTSNLLRDERGRPAGTVTLVKDITDIRQAQEALKESEERYRALVETAGRIGLGIAVLQDTADREGAIVFANQAMADMLGYTQEELTARVLADILPEKHRATGLETYHRRQRGELQAKPTEMTLVGKEGSPIQVEVTSGIATYQGKVATVNYVWDIRARRQMQRRLRLLSTAVEQTGEGVAVTDLEGKLMFSNPAYARMHGYEVEELLGKHFSILMDRGQGRLINASVEAHRREGQVSIELRRRRKDGSLFHSLTIWNPLKDERGRTLGTVTLVRDITEMKQAQEKLQLLSAAVEQAGEGMTITDREGKTVFTNPAFARMHGYEVEELLGKHFSLVLERGQGRLINAGIETLWREGQWRAELHRRRKDGSVFPALVTWSLLRDKEGQPLNTINVIKDISEMKRAQEAIMRRTQELAALVEAGAAITSTLELVSVLRAVVKAAPQVVPAADAGTLFLHNSASGLLEARAAWGLDEAIMLQVSLAPGEGVAGKVFLTGQGRVYTSAEEAARDRSDMSVENLALLRKAVRGAEPATNVLCASVAAQGKPFGVLIIYSLERRDGLFSPADLELLQAFANAAAVAVENARLHAELKEFAAGLERKVEERTRELEEAHGRLVRSERLAAIGQLASMVSHELRNPLAAMNNSVYYLKMKLPAQLGGSEGGPGAKARRHLEILEKEIATSNGIISQVLDFARPRPPALRECDLNSVVEEALGRLTDLDTVEVVRELAPGLPPLQADPDQMQQVFLNIIKNAAEAMPQGGRLTIATTHRHPYLEVSFQDTGPGIPPERRNHIFEPFFTTKARGTGLGLAISKSIVEAHQGSIEVQSQPGEGATFTVRLPLG